MSRIVVGGASGALGSLIVDRLLDKVDPSSLVLLSRTPEKLARHAEFGATVLFADHDDRSSLEKAYDGADAAMVISGLDIGRRMDQHRNVVEAANAAKVPHVVYTSVSGIHPKNDTPSSIEHRQTEALFRDGGIGYTFLRSACYAEIFLINAAMAYEYGAWLHARAPGPNRLAPISRDDLAASAAACLLGGETHVGATYEITGPELISMQQLAQTIGEEFGRPMPYHEVARDERYRQFDDAGVPRNFGPTDPPHPHTHYYSSDEIVIFELAVSAGLHGVLTDHVEYLTGRAPKDFRSVMRQHAAAHPLSA